MAIQNSTASARAGERSRSPSAAVYSRPMPLLEPDEAERVEAGPIITPVRPDSAHVRAPRFLDFAGDLVAAVLLIAGGVFAYGFVQLG